MELKVLGLNCWGIPVVSKNRKCRMRAIAAYIAESNYDVVCLQEVWSHNDFELIRDTAHSCLPHSHYFYSGVLGSGICTLSKYPILDVHFHKWMLNGYPHKVHHGDWWGGKGVGLCKIKVGSYNVNIYTTHLHAEYNRANDEYYACRAIQAFETAKFIEFSSEAADATFLIGDLNTEPGDLPYRLITSIPNLTDSYDLTDDKVDFCTNLHLDNSYTPARNKRKQIPGSRIDYILFKGGPGCCVNLKEYCLPLPVCVPGQKFSYSDHEAVAAILIIRKNEIACKATDILQLKSVLTDVIDSCDKALHSISWHKIFYWMLTVAILAAIIVTTVFDIPYDYYLHIIRIPLSFVMAYFFFMATFWNAMESNGIFAAKLEMELSLQGLDYR